MKEYRRLKILSKHRARRWDNITVPEIKLEGKWLEKLGFITGKEVKIKERKHKLIITLNNQMKKEYSVFTKIS